MQKNIDIYKYEKPIYLQQPQWAVNTSGTTWSPGKFSAEAIPSGVYKPISPWDSEPYLLRIQFVTDSLINLPDDPSTYVLEHIKDFWSKEGKFRKLGVTYKRGILLYGPPGSGKSVTIYRLAAEIEKNNAIMLMCANAEVAKLGIELIKTLEPTRKIVVIFEDIDAALRHNGDESMTHLLDGGTDVDNVVFLATTNYPERIPERILNRPSRFDVLIKIDMPSINARTAYIEHLVPDMALDIEQIAANTAGLSLAEIKEVIILMYVFDYTIVEALDKFNKELIDITTTNTLSVELNFESKNV